jgi:hypothetical protein
MLRWDLVRVCEVLARVWRQIPALVIQNCFQKAGFQIKGYYPPQGPCEEDPSVMVDRNIWERLQVKLGTSVSFTEFARVEEKIVIDEDERSWTNDEVIRYVETGRMPDDAYDSDEDEETEVDKENTSPEEYALLTSGQALGYIGSLCCSC